MIKYFGSISVSPGKVGKYYYSEFFQYYKLLAKYEPFRADNVGAALKYLADDKYSGFNISMPFKQQIIKYLDNSDNEVEAYGSCNTIKKSNGKLIGFNTDIKGIVDIVSNLIETDYVLVLGNGAMGKSFAKVLEKYRINFFLSSPSLKNWEDRHKKCDVLINCTSLGTSVNKSPIEMVNVSRAVFDLAINGDKLRELCKSVRYVSGLSFYKEVFLEQFFIHTGIHPNPEYFDYLTSLNISQ